VNDAVTDTICLKVGWWWDLYHPENSQSSLINLVYIVWNTLYTVLPWFAQVDGKNGAGRLLRIVRLYSDGEKM